MNTPTAVQLLRSSLDRFLAKDMKGWTELCDENVVAEFPFAPEGSPAKIEGRTALMNICGTTRVSSMFVRFPH